MWGNFDGFGAILVTVKFAIKIFNLETVFEFWEDYLNGLGDYQPKISEQMNIFTVFWLISVI